MTDTTSVRTGLISFRPDQHRRWMTLRMLTQTAEASHSLCCIRPGRARAAVRRRNARTSSGPRSH
jgi:hypothetical protein